MSDTRLLTPAELAEIRILADNAASGIQRLSSSEYAAEASVRMSQLLAHIEAQQETLIKAAALAEQLMQNEASDESGELLAELCDLLDPIETDPPSAEACDG